MRVLKRRQIISSPSVCRLVASGCIEIRLCIPSFLYSSMIGTYERKLPNITLCQFPLLRNPAPYNFRGFQINFPSFQNLLTSINMFVFHSFSQHTYNDRVKVRVLDISTFFTIIFTIFMYQLVEIIKKFCAMTTTMDLIILP